MHLPKTQSPHLLLLRCFCSYAYLAKHLFPSDDKPQPPAGWCVRTTVLTRNNGPWDPCSCPRHQAAVNGWLKSIRTRTMLLSFVHTASFQRPYVRDFLRQRSLCLSSSSWTFPAWICTAPSWDRFCFGIHSTLLHLRPQTTKAHNCTGILRVVWVFNLFYFGFYIVWLKTNHIYRRKRKSFTFFGKHTRYSGHSYAFLFMKKTSNITVT